MTLTETTRRTVVQRSSNIGRSRGVLAQIEAVCARRDLAELGARIGGLGGALEAELEQVETELEGIARGGSAVERSAAHLLDLGGKRLRPLLVMLSARLFGGLLEAVRDLALAVEVVHAATLLHDDVVDLGDTRRGAPASRMLYGNAASIFAGDYLLIEALRRVQSSRAPGVLDRLLAVIEQMILAESIQLERRGRIEADRAAYFAIIEGKTASLFGFASWAGARAAGATGQPALALEKFGFELGVAFQAVDDALDLAGEAGAVKKTLFADLREGKITLPLLYALERDETGEAQAALASIAAAADGAPIDEALRQSVVSVLGRTGAIEETLAFARARAEAAKASLAPLPASPERELLELVADAAVSRSA